MAFGGGPTKHHGPGPHVGPGQRLVWSVAASSDPASSPVLACGACGGPNAFGARACGTCGADFVSAPLPAKKAPVYAIKG